MCVCERRGVRKVKTETGKETVSRDVWEPKKNKIKFSREKNKQGGGGRGGKVKLAENSRKI